MSGVYDLSFIKSTWRDPLQTSNQRSDQTQQMTRVQAGEKQFLQLECAVFRINKLIDQQKERVKKIISSIDQSRKINKQTLNAKVRAKFSIKEDVVIDQWFSNGLVRARFSIEVLNGFLVYFQSEYLNQDIDSIRIIGWSPLCSEQVCRTGNTSSVDSIIINYKNGGPQTFKLNSAVNKFEAFYGSSGYVENQPNYYHFEDKLRHKDGDIEVENFQDSKLYFEHISTRSNLQGQTGSPPLSPVRLSSGGYPCQDLGLSRTPCVMHPSSRSASRTSLLSNINEEFTRRVSPPASPRRLLITRDNSVVSFGNRIAFLQQELAEKNQELAEKKQEMENLQRDLQELSPIFHARDVLVDTMAQAAPQSVPTSQDTTPRQEFRGIQSDQIEEFFRDIEVVRLRSAP